MKKFLPVILVLLIFASSLKLSSQGIITTTVGTGVAGYTGDGGPATSCEANQPCGIVFDPAGNMFFADDVNHCIRKVTPGGIISTIAGTGVAGFSGDGGPAIAAQLNGPVDLAFDSSGNLYISDYDNNRVRKINTSGTITTIAGNGAIAFGGDGGPATSASIYGPTGLCFDASGNLYIADEEHNRIRKVDASGTISTFAGTGSPGYSGDGGAAISAKLFTPYGLTLDLSGNLIIADFGNNVIRKVTPSGTISTIAGNNMGGYTGDGGPALSAGMNGPVYVSYDGIGNLYVTEEANHCVRKVNTSGIISTVAGNGSAGFSGDGGSSTSAKLQYPYSGVIGPSGDLYIGDAVNNRIRMVSLSTGLNEILQAEKEFAIFPNLCTTTLYINNTGSHFQSLKLLDVLGKEMFSKNEAVSSIDLSAFENGVYFVHLSTIHSTLVKKIIKH